MKKYLQAIIAFDVVLPTLLLGVPTLVVLFALLNLQNFVEIKTSERTEFGDQSRLVTVLNTQLEPVMPKLPLLKELVSRDDVETRLGKGIASALDKYSPYEIQPTLEDFQLGPSSIGQNLGEGRRLSLKLSSRWEPLNSAAVHWETHFPNLILESLNLDVEGGSATAAPYLKSTFSYFIVTE